MARRLSARGSWPGPVTLRSGWEVAHVRPTDDSGPDATLRLDRGSVEFLVLCRDWLFARGVGAVVSAPLAPGGRRPWEEAGFTPDRELLLLERDLSFPVPAPTATVRRAAVRERDRVAEIDDAAFAPGWRIGRAGIADALGATVESALFVAEAGGSVAGFAIAGAARPTGYLQRIAVDPAHQAAGLGRSLVRACLGWAKNRGMYTVMLNTQPDNAPALALYLSERFEVLRDRLLIMRAEAEGAG